MDAQVAIAHAHRGDLADPQSQGYLIVAAGAAALRRAAKAQGRASAAFAHPELVLHVPDKVAATVRR